MTAKHQVDSKQSYFREVFASVTCFLWKKEIQLHKQMLQPRILRLNELSLLSYTSIINWFLIRECIRNSKNQRVGRVCNKEGMVDLKYNPKISNTKPNWGTKARIEIRNWWDWRHGKALCRKARDWNNMNFYHNLREFTLNDWWHNYK